MNKKIIFTHECIRNKILVFRNCARFVSEPKLALLPLAPVPDFSVAGVWMKKYNKGTTKPQSQPIIKGFLVAAASLVEEEGVILYISSFELFLLLP